MSFCISSDCLCLVLSFFTAHKMIQFRQINNQWNKSSRLPLCWNKHNRLSVNCFENQFLVNHLRKNWFEWQDIVQFKHCKSLRIHCDEVGHCSKLEENDIESFNQANQCLSQNRVHYSAILLLRNLTCLEVTYVSSILLYNVISITGRYYGNQLENLKLYTNKNAISLESMGYLLKSLQLFTKLIKLELNSFWFLFSDKITYNIQYLSELPLSKTLKDLCLNHCFTSDNYNNMNNYRSDNENLLHLLKFKQLSNLTIYDTRQRFLTQTEETRMHCIAQELISGLPNLETLPFYGKSYYNKCISSKNLKRLRYSIQTEDMCKYTAAEFPGVKELIINRIDFVSKIVEFGPQLKQLELSNVSFDRVNTLWQQMLFYCTHSLTELRLCAVTFNFPNPLQYLQNCCMLQHLEIRCCDQVNDLDLLDLLQHYPPHLYKLKLLNNLEITNQTINNLSKNSHTICLTSLVVQTSMRHHNFEIGAFQRLLLKNIQLVNLDIHLPSNDCIRMPLDLQKQLRNYYNTIVQRDLSLPACEITCNVF